MTTRNIILINLPKWPQMIVTGMPVTVDQAKEIIRRTDTFFSWPWGAGNDRLYASRVCEALAIPPDGQWEEQNTWRDRWEFVSTEYVLNSWIAGSFIGGPHGWCHPDGRIGFVDNVGKWPSVEDVLGDWMVLADTFTFIQAGITLMSGESCEEGVEPLVKFRVSGGKAWVVDLAEDVHAGRPPAVRRGDRTPTMEEDVQAIVHRYRERGISWEWIEEWAGHVRLRSKETQL